MSSIELRKVQIAGGSTFTVSLPKPWAREHGIRNGDRVAMERREDGALVVHPAEVARPESPAVRLNADRLRGTALLRSLIGQYLAGHDAILIHATPRLTSDQRETIRRFTRSCVGPEIVEETGEQVLVRDLVNAFEFTLPSALNRIHLIVRSMIEDSLAALRENNLDVAADVRTRDDEVDRLHRLVAKRFVKMLAGGPGSRDPSVTLLQAQRLHQVSRLLERCADHAANVAQLATQLRSRAPRPEDLDRLLALGRRAIDLLDRSFQSFRRADAAQANAVVDESIRLVAEKARLREAMMGYGPQSAATLSLLVESLERIHQYASDVAEVALNGSLPMESLENPSQTIMRRANLVGRRRSGGGE